MQLGHAGGTPMSGVSTLQKRSARPPLLLPPCVHTVRQTPVTRHSCLGFSASVTVRNKLLSFISHPVMVFSYSRPNGLRH
jgi:hypothetical protein